MPESPDTEPMNAEAPSAGTDPAATALDSAAPKLPPRVAHWCSMLLDLSRRNRLLNFKDGAGAVRLAFDAPEFLEDAIAEDKVYRLLETPEKGPRIAALFPDETPSGSLRSPAPPAGEPAPSLRGLQPEAGGGVIQHSAFSIAPPARFARQLLRRDSVYGSKPAARRTRWTAATSTSRGRTPAFAASAAAVPAP